MHVPWFVDRYGICGVFGEDGTEALHVVDNLCRRLVRQIRHSEDRHKAHTLHHTARSFTSSLYRKPHTEAKQAPKEGRRCSWCLCLCGGEGEGGQ